MTHEYGKPLIGMALGDQRLFSGIDARWKERWEPSTPEKTATLWRYMSFAKFCSLLDRKSLFFSLVGDMDDKYEGFIYPPVDREQEDRLQQAERRGHDVLNKMARAALISCWTESSHESSLMWKSYAGSEGVAIRTTFENLQKSIRSIGELPVTFGQVEYVDYGSREVPRFGWAPLFHKRIQFREENEVRAVLPGPPVDRWLGNIYEESSDVPLDPDVAEQRGRYIPVDLEILVNEIVLPPFVAPWFGQVVNSIMPSSLVSRRVTRSSIEAPPDQSANWWTLKQES